ncbi:MAG: DUF465 domain-containing protein [Pseudomonadota bacterium]
MSAPDDDKALRAQLSVLRQEHRDLDHAIDALDDNPTRNDLQIRRLKKKKLALKDQILKLELRLVPDIIA